MQTPEALLTSCDGDWAPLGLSSECVDLYHHIVQKTANPERRDFIR